jgi:hypothetical protein
MLVDPGAIAAPMNDNIAGPTRNNFRAWNVSDADEIMGATTAWTSERALGTHVWVALLSRSVPM